MSRTVSFALPALIVLVAAAVHADPVQHITLDLKDFDDDAMRDMDDANKDLQPVIGAKNAQQALTDAQTIQSVLKEAESYFSKKGGTQDAVRFAQQGETALDAVVSALDKGDFDAAGAAARDVTRNCKACHDVYKPLTK
jgi:soluble cytochrome b562